MPKVTKPLYMEILLFHRQDLTGKLYRNYNLWYSDLWFDREFLDLKTLKQVWQGWLWCTYSWMSWPIIRDANQIPTLENNAYFCNVTTYIHILFLLYLFSQCQNLYCGSTGNEDLIWIQRCRIIWIRFFRQCGYGS